jgi:hypothetical protein
LKQKEDAVTILDQAMLGRRRKMNERNEGRGLIFIVLVGG